MSWNKKAIVGQITGGGNLMCRLVWASSDDDVTSKIYLYGLTICRCFWARELIFGVCEGRKRFRLRQSTALQLT